MAAGDPGTRTAPLFTATATDRLVTIHVVDRSGDNWAETFRFPVGQSASTIETVIAAYQAATQASVWKVTDQLIREGAEVSANANIDQRNQASQGINLLFKNPTSHITYTPRIVAPVLAAMQGDQDIPVVDADPVEAFISAYVAILASFNFQSAQYTDRRERKNNPRVSA